MALGSNKRSRQSPEPYTSNANLHPALYPAPSSTPSAIGAPSSSSNNSYGGSGSGNSNSNSSSSSFRNVSACNRCRLRKNRCDQNLPACTSCQKASAKCVGFDPITRREIPRTYVYFLESRVAYLEEQLSKHNIPFIAPSNDFDLGSKPVIDAQSAGLSPTSDAGGLVGGGHSAAAKRHARARSFNSAAGSESGTEWEQKEESDKLNKLVSNIGMVSVQGASDPRYLGSTSGISFARVVFAAVKSSVNDKNGRNSSVGSATAATATTTSTTTNGPSMRDSFFGLQTKPHFKPAPFPDRELGAKLVELYFEHPNPQIPILHRGEFMEMFARAYATGRERQRSARELYMLNIVFAIGAGTILLDSKSEAAAAVVKQEPLSPSLKKPKLSGLQRQPEEYHSSAMMHLESFLGSIPTPTSPEKPEVFGGSLEQLQAVLLLAGFALLRPVAPGLWYIVGVAMRLALDLGLHYEDGGGGDNSVSSAVEEVNAGARLLDAAEQAISAEERGRREWVRDMRRRLWWCVYSFDRLVSTCVGRPFGVTDQVITTEWPSLLDDIDITPAGFRIPSYGYHGPSYKRVSHHYFRLRLLQSEILQVLQYRQAQRIHDKDRGASNIYMHTTLSSSFLQPFRNSFSAWRADIDHRLWEWKESAPLQKDTSVGFNVKFLELNYWQAVIMLYRQSLSVPPSLACEKGPHNDVESPMSTHTEDHEDEDEIFLKVAEAGQRVLRLYKELHRVGLVNYTYLATVHLFMAGIAFLYSIWHSPMVRARMTLEHVEYTVRAATSVLGDLVQKCPPAEACRDAFDRMAKATIKMCQNTTGFGSQVRFSSDPPSSTPFIPHGFETEVPKSVFSAGSILATGGSRPPPQFDYNLKDLFPEANFQVRRFGQNEDGSSSGGSAAGWMQQTTGQAPSQQYHYPSPAPTNTSLTSSSNPTSNPSSVTSNPHPTFRQPSYGTTTTTTQPHLHLSPPPHQQQQQQHLQQHYHQQHQHQHEQQQQQQHYDPRLMTNTNTNTNPNTNTNTYYDPPTQPQSQTQSIFDLDFDFLTTHHDSMPASYNGDAATGLNLGFDGRADWSGAGEMPDLFGGFFFGGGGGPGGGELGVEGVEIGEGMEGMEMGGGGHGGGHGGGGGI